MDARLMILWSYFERVKTWSEEYQEYKHIKKKVKWKRIAQPWAIHWMRRIIRWKMIRRIFFLKSMHLSCARAKKKTFSTVSSWKSSSHPRPQKLWLLFVFFYLFFVGLLYGYRQPSSEWIKMNKWDTNQKHTSIYLS